VGTDLEALHQGARSLVLLDVQVEVGVAVALEELADPERAGAVARAQHHRVPEVVRDEGDAAEDEGPHQQLAELGVGHHQVP
jgi:hypothetical protein